MVSGNGWGVILDETQAGRRLTWWTIPGCERTFRLHKGPAGLILAHLASWFNDRIEALDPGVDDWGWSPRPNTSKPDEWSNHASATAIDCNALLHPYGQPSTFTPKQNELIIRHVNWCDGVIGWGGAWRSAKDEMHFEIQTDDAEKVSALAKKVRQTTRGHRLLDANR